MPAPSQRDALGKLPPWMPAGPTVGRILPAIDPPLSRSARLAAHGARRAARSALRATGNEKM